MNTRSQAKMTANTSNQQFLARKRHTEHTLEHSIKVKDLQIALGDAKLRLKKIHLQNKNIQLTQKDAEISLKEEEITKKDEEINQKNIEIEALNTRHGKYLNYMFNILDTSNAKNRELSLKEIDTRKDAEITRKNAEINQKNIEIEALNTENKRLSNIMDVIITRHHISIDELIQKNTKKNLEIQQLQSTNDKYLSQIVEVTSFLTLKHQEAAEENTQLRDRLNKLETIFSNMRNFIEESK